MAQVVNVAGQQYKIRNIFAVWIGLPIITLGVYAFVWYYKINSEARRYLGDENIKPVLSLLAVTIGWVLIVPPYISIYRTAQRVQRMQQQAGISNQITPWIALALAFVLNLDRLYLQSELNKVWERYTVPVAGYMPPPPPHPAPPYASPPPPHPPAA